MMSKLAQSSANSQPARLPAITIPPGVDAALRQTLEAMKERLEVRDGARGNPYERGLTVRDLVDAGVDITLVGQRVVPRGDGRRAPSGSLGSVGEAQVPASIEALIRSSLSAEAARLGADIRRTEHKLQSATESLATKTEQLTAALGQATAGVRQISYAQATSTRATAGLITQLAAALDGTGSATLQESMVVIADRTGGLRSQYMLKLAAGNVISGISLLASEDPGGVTESAFIVQADRFQVKTAGGTKTPFGIDGSNIYLDGTVRINAGGQTLATLATNAAVPAITYIGAFSSAPATATLKKNNVYRNTTDGNTYILSADAGVWQLYLEKGATGATGSAGAAGARGSIQLYQSGTWSDAGATAAILGVTGTANRIGDTVTFSNGATATTKYWSGSAWVDPGVVINGNLLVGGNISSSSVDTSQYVKAQGFGTAGGSTGSVIGENPSSGGHGGHAVLGVNSNAAGGYGGYFYGSRSDGYGLGVMGLAGSNGIGVKGQSMGAGSTGVYGLGLLSGVGVRGTGGGAGVWCDGPFKFGSYTYATPDGSANKYLSANGTWRRPLLSDIEPNNADTPTFQFSTDGGSTWTSILLKRL